MSMWYIVYILMVVAGTSFGQKDYCREGAYGNNCELTCPKQCRPLQTFPCNKKTGRCSEGCNSGYYGDKCDKTCSCPSGICFQDGGECYGSDTTTYNTTKRVIYTTTPSVHNPMNEKVEAGWRTTAIIFIVFFILLLVGVLVMFLHVSRNWKKQGKPSTVEMTTENCPLVKAGSDVEAAEGGSEETQSPGGLPGNMPKVYKGATEVEELKQDKSHLQSEKDRAEDKCKTMMKKLASLEYQEKEIQRLFDLPSNSTNHFMEKCQWLQCPNLKFDKAMVNVKVAEIDDNSMLRNNPDTRKIENEGNRFQNFNGTTCTEPIVKSNYYQYFEAVFDIKLRQSVGEGVIVMQLGFCKEEDRDVTSFIDQNEKDCFVLKAIGCKTHKEICLVCTKDGKDEHVKRLKENVEGSNCQVNIGIRLTKKLDEIKVYECKMLEDIVKTNIKIGEKIWPVFGVYDGKEVSVKVELNAGRDIIMWEKKKKTIKSKHM